MPEPIVSNDIPPGDYSIPGSDQVLVIEGRAYWRPPAAPKPLVTPQASPARPASGGPSLTLSSMLAAIGVVAGVIAGPTMMDRIKPSAPAVVPTPAPAPGIRPELLDALSRRLDRMEADARAASVPRPSPQSP